MYLERPCTPEEVYSIFIFGKGLEHSRRLGRLWNPFGPIYLGPGMLITKRHGESNGQANQHEMENGAGIWRGLRLRLDLA